ncbi:MAG: GMC family oxidoreductase [Kiritimatiellae bacterium]|nr:GMC family oxidoreductase [Kiritimatiellia bacterium]
MEFTDAIVVGSGAGGGCCAKVLAAAGIRVVMFERGEWNRTDPLGEDDLAGQRSPCVVLGPGPHGRRTRKEHFQDNGDDGVVRPNNAACVGSGTVTYGAMGWRFLPDDFRLKSKYGELEGSTMDDWPFTYDDLEPFYEQAEWEVGVAGSDEGNPFCGPRKKNYPMPPFPYTPESKIMDEAFRKQGLHPFPTPLLRNSIPFNGRPACIHNRFCVGYQCPIDAKNGTQNTVIPAAIATGNLDLRIRCMVVEVMMDDTGKAVGVKYFDENHQLRELRAKVVVLAAAALGTARLLLASKSGRFPNGIGNAHDVVGRTVQTHRYVGARGFWKEELFTEDGPGTNVAICDYSHDNPGFVGGGILHTDFQFTPYIFAGGSVLHGTASWGQEHKDLMRRFYRRQIRIIGPIQDMPTWQRRVVLNDSARDCWGLPFVRSEGQGHINDVKAGNFLSDRAYEILQKTGAEHIQHQGKSDHLPFGGGGQHQGGTCRMGKDPKTSVTDGWGKVHETENLYLADGSLLVSIGGFNPALTIMALGFRVGAGIVRDWDSMKG